MIGGGIFAVLGVVASTSGEAAWMAFMAAGVIALCSGATSIALNNATGGQGGPVTYIQQFVGQPTFAGMAGWTLTVGYIQTASESRHSRRVQIADARRHRPPGRPS